MERYMTTADIAAHYRRAESTIRYWRHIRFGPRGLLIRGKVMYHPDEVARFDQELLDGLDRQGAA